MKHLYIPSVAAIFALIIAILSVHTGTISYKVDVSSAQSDEAFEMKLYEPGTKTINSGFSGFVYNFARDAEVSSVKAMYCCFLGTIRLSLDSVVVAEQNKTLHACSHCSNDNEEVIWSFPAGTVADKIEISNNVRYFTEIKYTDLLAKRTEAVQVTDQAKNLGRIANIVSSTAGVQTIAVSSSNPKVIVWLGGVEEYSKKQTTVFTDTAYACADLNSNGQCDFLTLCGNGNIDSGVGEVCDGNNFGGRTCSEAGTGYTGNLSCTNSCKSVSTSNCVPPQCNDGRDNDNDGPADYPNDASCSSATDNDEANPVQCADGRDNDNDGDIDGADAGCTDTSDNNEGDDPECSDGQNNDTDVWEDYPDDPGCDNTMDTTEDPNPQCSDGVDNDLDGRTDYLEDTRGCSDKYDNDESNPLIDRNITYTKRTRPQLIIQPLLQEDEVITFTNNCATCQVTYSEDPVSFVAGTPRADNGFVIIATYLDTTDESLSHVILAVGDYVEETQVFNAAGLEFPIVSD